MNLPYVIAILHLLTFGLGVSSCWARVLALKRLKDQSGVNAVLTADNLWGVSALLWLITGLWRAFGGLEKGTDYYLNSTAFLIKMGFFVLIFILEITPIVTFTRWRILKRRGQPIDFGSVPTLTKISVAELILLIPIVIMAAAVSRGIIF